MSQKTRRLKRRLEIEAQRKESPEQKQKDFLKQISKLFSMGVKVVISMRRQGEEEILVFPHSYLKEINSVTIRFDAVAPPIWEKRI